MINGYQIALVNDARQLHCIADQMNQNTGWKYDCRLRKPTASDEQKEIIFTISSQFRRAVEKKKLKNQSRGFFREEWFSWKGLRYGIFSLHLGQKFLGKKSIFLFSLNFLVFKHADWTWLVELLTFQIFSTFFNFFFNFFLNFFFNFSKIKSNSLFDGIIELNQLTHECNIFAIFTRSVQLANWMLKHFHKCLMMPANWNEKNQKWSIGKQIGGAERQIEAAFAEVAQWGVLVER